MALTEMILPDQASTPAVVVMSVELPLPKLMLPPETLDVPEKDRLPWVV